MKPNKKFMDLDLEFWGLIKFLNQRLGYYERKSLVNPNPNFVIPTEEQIVGIFGKENLDYSQIVSENHFTTYGKLIQSYFAYRSKVLNEYVKPNLMDSSEAKNLFHNLKNTLNPICPLPLNKQSGDKKDYAFFTCIINILIEKYSQNYSCDFDPRELTSISTNGIIRRTLSRRVDGAFPSISNPIALWEIKEYYYTTTFGSRVADGIYETILDGMELKEVNQNLDIKINHYLMIDDFNTWWNMGRSYLCRIIDILHMGMIDEVLVGKEVTVRIPTLVKEWITELRRRK